MGPQIRNSHCRNRTATARIAARNPEIRLRFLISSRAAHSIQKQIAALTNHKEYAFKQSSA